MDSNIDGDSQKWEIHRVNAMQLWNTLRLHACIVDIERPLLQIGKVKISL